MTYYLFALTNLSTPCEMAVLALLDTILVIGVLCAALAIHQLLKR